MNRITLGVQTDSFDILFSSIDGELLVYPIVTGDISDELMIACEDSIKIINEVLKGE